MSDKPNELRKQGEIVLEFLLHAHRLMIAQEKRGGYKNLEISGCLMHRAVIILGSAA